MKIKLELLSSAAAYREVENRVLKQPVTIEFDRLLKDTFKYQDEPLLYEPYKIVKNIDKKIRNGRITKLDQAHTRRRIFISLIVSRMIRFQRLCFDFLAVEEITLIQFRQAYAHHYHCTKFITEEIKKHSPIQKRIIELAKVGTRVKLDSSSKIPEIEAKLADVTNTTGKNLFRQFINTRKAQDLEEELLKEKEDNFMSSNKFSIEDICYRFINGSDLIPNSINLRTVLSKTLFDRIWKLSPTAQKKLMEMVVSSYKATYSLQIAQLRKKNTKDRKLKWSRKNNIKETSAQDKRELVREHRANGLTQREAAIKIGCSVSSVHKYWKEKAVN